jgi:hypothetical protein
VSVNVKNIHVGDYVEFKSPEVLPRADQELGTESFEVIFVNSKMEDPTNPSVIIRAKGGWQTLNNKKGHLSISTSIPEEKKQLEFLRTQDFNAWWIRPIYIKKVISKGYSGCSSDGVYNPLTSRVKSKEELEQYKKDFEFFFRDLTKPYVPPEDAWAKWS